MLQALGIVGTVLAAGALVASAVSYVRLARMGHLTSDYLRRRGWIDGWLLAVWGLLLAGSVGLLTGATWAGTVLRVWTGLLAAWTLWYTFANLYTLRGLAPEVPVRWGSVIAGYAVVWLLVGGLTLGVHVLLGQAGL